MFASNKKYFRFHRYIHYRNWTYCFRLSAVVVLLAFPACTRGIPEFQQYTVAFDAQHMQAMRVLDRLAVAERTLFALQQETVEEIPDFDPDAASYYLSVSDPPRTAAIRASLDAVRDYNAALADLSTGASAAELAARARHAASATAGATAAATLPTLGVGAAAVPVAEGALAALTPVFERLTALEDRAAFRDLLLEAYADVRMVMVTTREGTPAMFEVIKRSYVQPGALGGDFVEGIARPDVLRLAQDRELLAAWVVLLDRTLLAMDQAVAVASPGAATDPATLTDAAVDMRVMAGAVGGVGN